MEVGSWVSGWAHGVYRRCSARGLLDLRRRRGGRPIMQGDFSKVSSDDAAACSRRKGDLPLRSDGSWQAAVWAAVGELVEGVGSEGREKWRKPY